MVRKQTKKTANIKRRKRKKRRLLTDGQNGHTDVLRDERLPIDQVLPLTELHDLSDGETEARADDGTECDFVTIREKDNVKPRLRGGAVIRRMLVAYSLCTGVHKRQYTRRKTAEATDMCAPGDVKPFSNGMLVTRIQHEIQREV
jgi:hypothetical protein